MGENSVNFPVSIQEFDFGVHGFPQIRGVGSTRPRIHREKTYLRPGEQFVAKKKVSS